MEKLQRILAGVFYQIDNSGQRIIPSRVSVRPFFWGAPEPGNCFPFLGTAVGRQNTGSLRYHGAASRGERDHIYVKANWRRCGKSSDLAMIRIHRES